MTHLYAAWKLEWKRVGRQSHSFLALRECAWRHMSNTPEPMPEGNAMPCAVWDASVEGLLPFLSH